MRKLEVNVPHIPFGPDGVPGAIADAEYFRHAARNIQGGYSVGGYNVTTAVINLLHNAAEALEASHRTGEPT